jgi:predicted ArsR family transcriptional regulator
VSPAATPPSNTPWAYLEVLSEPRRRAIYDAVAAAARPLTRDEVAATCGVTRDLAAFHLDKLHEAGLLKVDFERADGIGGPGSGRPPKRYRLADVEVQIQLPRREYELAARILVTAARASSPSGGLPPAIRAAARAEGHRLGRMHRKLSPGAGVAAVVRAARETLTALGYQPIDEPGPMRLANCPFHSLVEADRELVCALNVAFVKGIVTGLEGARTSAAKPGPKIEARLAPGVGRCCVVVAPTARTASAKTPA